MKFAHFHDGGSHQFEFDEEISDFAMEFAKAARERKSDSFVALAQQEGITDFQKSMALEQAVLLGRNQESEWIEQIPIEEVRKTAWMSQQRGGGGATAVIEKFAEEKIGEWPFWKRGDGYRLRGRAFFLNKNGAEAERDFAAALPWLSDQKMRDSLLVMRAQNRERNLQDADGALEVYQEIVSGRERFGSSDEFYALQGIARIQTERGEFEAALKTLNRANPEKLKGTWKKSFAEAIEEVEKAKR